MQKADVITQMAKIVNAHNLRKTVHVDKRILKIVDVTKEKNEDMAGRITIQPKDKLVRYTKDDAACMLEAFVLCLQDALTQGESVSVKGLGTFSLVRRKARKTKIPGTEQWVDIPERFVVKFTPNYGLRNAARVYTLSFQGNPTGFQLPDPMYDQFEFPDEDEDENEVGEENGDSRED